MVKSSITTEYTLSHKYATSIKCAKHMHMHTKQTVYFVSHITLCALSGWSTSSKEHAQWPIKNLARDFKIWQVGKKYIPNPYQLLKLVRIFLTLQDFCPNPCENLVLLKLDFLPDSCKDFAKILFARFFHRVVSEMPTYFDENE